MLGILSSQLAFSAATTLAKKVRAGAPPLRAAPAAALTAGHLPSRRPVPRAAWPTNPSPAPSLQTFEFSITSSLKGLSDVIRERFSNSAVLQETQGELEMKVLGGLGWAGGEAVVLRGGGGAQPCRCKRVEAQASTNEPRLLRLPSATGQDAVPARRHPCPLRDARQHGARAAAAPLATVPASSCRGRRV